MKVKVKKKTCPLEFLPDFLPGLRWIGHESFKHSQHFILDQLSCKFKCRVFLAIPVCPFLAVDISKISATCDEPLNRFPSFFVQRPPQWSASSIITKCDIDTRILQQQSNNGHLTPLAGL